MDSYRHRPNRPLQHNPQAITYARQQAGLTKTQLAKLCGVGVSLISELESGTRNATPAMLNRLALVLSCPRSMLAGTTFPDRTDDPAAYNSTQQILGRINVTGTEAAAFIRFAAEFMSHAKWAPATPEGLEEAYLATIPVYDGHEDLHIYMQDLGDNVRTILREDFKTWTSRQRIRLPPDATAEAPRRPRR